MQPVVSSGKAYFCTVISAFGVVILSILGMLFHANNEILMGSTSAPKDGVQVAHTLWGASLVYLLFFLFCGSQIVLINRNSRIKL